MVKTLINKEYVHLSDTVGSIPSLFLKGEGQLLRKERNEVRQFCWDGQDYVVKSFARVNPVNRLVYRWFRKSKAQRSYENAERLRTLGLGSPTPVAWLDGGGLVLTESYYVSAKSCCEYCLRDVLSGVYPGSREQALLAFGRYAGRMHAAGLLHKDFSASNVLVGEADGQVTIELIDLNRVRSLGSISVERGMANVLERIPLEKADCEPFVKGYAEARGVDADQCLALLLRKVDQKENGSVSNNE